MCEVIAESKQAARKPHVCTWCGQKIEVGMQYHRERIKIDGDVNTQRFHLECLSALRDLSRYEAGGGCVYFDFASMPRGGFDPEQAVQP